MHSQKCHVLMSVRAVDMEQAKREAEVHILREDAAWRDIAHNVVHVSDGLVP